MSLPRPRGCLAGLAVVLVLGGVALFLAWRALDTAFLEAFVEARLSATLGTPVTIGRMRLSLGGTPAVECRQIRVGSGAIAAAPSVSIAAVRIVPQLSS